MCFASASERVKLRSHSGVVMLDRFVHGYRFRKRRDGWTNQEENNKTASPSYDSAYGLSAHTH